MKYSKAKEIGVECGLETDMEIIGNIHIHCMSLFNYEDISIELGELRKDCIKLGINYDGIIECHNQRFLNAVNRIEKEKNGETKGKR
jgi:hypothetical protein